MLKPLLLSLLALGVCVGSTAQSKPKVRRGDFLTQEAGRDSAKTSLKKGDRLYKKGPEYYEEAAKHYQTAYNYNQENKALNYKLGKCLLYGTDRAKALEPLEASDPSIMPDYYLLLGRAYQYSGDYRRAIEAYERYLSVASDHAKKLNEAQVRQYIIECDFSSEAMKDSAAMFVTNMNGKINTYYDEYAPVLTLDGESMLFTSRKPDKMPKTIKTRYGETEQIYETKNPLKYDATDAWQHGRLTSLRNMAVAGYSKTEERIYFYKGKTEEGRLRTSARNDAGNGWRRSRRLKRRVNRIAYKEGALSLDGQNNLYFISDRKDGVGGSDVWYAEYKGGHSWHKPVNMGTVINTPMEEVYVHVTYGGDTLYVCSNGRAGFGGFDIYMSVRQADGAWGEPVNMGYPVNTAYDEVSYLPTADPDVALVSSSRPGTRGGLDIFSLTVDHSMPFTLAFRGVEERKGTPLAINYKIINKKSGEDLSDGTTTADETLTKYSFGDHGLYTIEYTAEGYHSYTDTIECPATKGETIERILKLAALKHPFTLMGKVTNKSTGSAVAANIEFRDTKGAILGNTTSSALTGKYSFDFDDKIDVVVEARATDYVDASATVMATQTDAEQITQDLMMEESKRYFVLMGTVKDDETGAPVAAQLRITPSGAKQAETVVIADSVSAKYSANMLTSGPYWIDIEAKGYFFASDAINFGGERFAQRNYTLKKMKAGVKITLENILFKTGSSQLTKSSFEPLDKFADLLKKNPDVRIEVSGHTDNVGKAAANKKLSKARAKSVRDYLIKQGVSADRIDYEGYGMEQPVESNKTKAGREKNRRVEVKVLD